MLMKTVMTADGIHGYGNTARRVTRIYSGVLQSHWASRSLSHIVFLRIQLSSGLGQSSSALTGNDLFMCSFKPLVVGQKVQQR